MRPTPILTLDELAYVLAERPERLNALAKTGAIPSAQTSEGRVYNLNAVVDALRRLNPPLTDLRIPRPQTPVRQLEPAC